MIKSLSDNTLNSNILTADLLSEVLILNGIDITLKTNFPKTYPHTPLDFALEKSHQTTANLIRKHGGKTAKELKAEGK